MNNSNLKLVGSILLVLPLTIILLIMGCRPTPPANMIAISVVSPDLGAEVDPNFGRSEWFIIIDTETMEYEFIEGVGATLDRGAGKVTADQIVNKGVGAVLTGSCGSGAYAILSSAGVRVIIDVSGIVEDVINQYKLGNY